MWISKEVLIVVWDIAKFLSLLVLLYSRQLVYHICSYTVIVPKDWLAGDSETWCTLTQDTNLICIA